jgi:hypothetical protein
MLGLLALGPTALVVLH